MLNQTVHIIGCGLAGSEAAWQLAEKGVPVTIHEMRPITQTPAHQTDHCAELVCSNSFRSDDWRFNAVGLLHEEMRRCGSLIMQAADACQVPAGGALAVDREGFSALVTQKLKNHPLIRFENKRIDALPNADWGLTIVATGPLTHDALAEDIKQKTGADSLAFFDAIAPIVYKDSINMDIAWFQSRYDKIGPGGTGKDYINCPMNKDQYYTFIEALKLGEKTEFKEWEKKVPYFEACLPIEVMAERGVETLRFGPMKPIGLKDPRNDENAYAVVQLRQDNALGTLFNMVGFQTKLKYTVQKDIFRMIPGLENAEFARLGGIHKNSFIKSPELLDAFLRLKTHPHLRFAGQMTGCEGYIESASVGLMAGLFTASEFKGENLTLPPVTTALGSLLNHITTGAVSVTFQPMNINYGLFPPLDFIDEKKRRKMGKKERAEAHSLRALEALQNFCSLDKTG